MPSTTITINITNNSTNNQNFFIFQEPAIYTGGPNVYSNSLYSATVLPYASSGASLSFSMGLDFYAGAQQQVSTPVVGQPSGQLSAIQPIGLTPAAGGTPTNNTTDMTVTPSLGLSPASSTSGVEPGAFRIVVPTYDGSLYAYNIGSAVQSVSTGLVTLANFVLANPNTDQDCQPILKFYVATGTYTAGTVMDFDSSSATAALCDATQGDTSFQVGYGADGSWTVSGAADVIRADGKRALVSRAVAQNAEVWNEAGSARVATGYAANFNDPVTIQALSAPLVVGRDYQIGPVGGPRKGRTCLTYLAGVATFSSH